MQVHSRSIAALVIAAVLMYSTEAGALSCVPFAREVSGISLRGDAWTWWNGAVGQYDRGQAPRQGAVFVFKKHGSMHHGHVAVVARVINSRKILVNHANWAPHRGHGRGQVSTMVAVADVSPRNDWTEVRVWNAATQDFGTRIYPTYGFVYPKVSHPHPQRASVAKDGGDMPAGPAVAGTDQPGAAIPLDAGAHTVAEVKPAEATAVLAKTEVTAAVLVTDPKNTEAAWDGDRAAAERSGAGHY